MEKIKDINSIKLINSKTLIEVESKQFNKETTSGIIVGDQNYNKDVHAIRYGVLRGMPVKMNYKTWKTDYYPEINSEVWFDFTATLDATYVEHDGKIYLVLPYESLIVARSSNKGIRCLNGYLLAQKVLQYAKGDIVKGVEMTSDRYYDDIYMIKYAGKPNLSYTDERYVDDKSITEGMRVMTRASNYPILEEKIHWKFNNETYYYFQRRDVVGKVEEL